MFFLKSEEDKSGTAESLILIRPDSLPQVEKVCTSQVFLRLSYAPGQNEFVGTVPGRNLPALHHREQNLDRGNG